MVALIQGEILPEGRLLQKRVYHSPMRLRLMILLMLNIVRLPKWGIPWEFCKFRSSRILVTNIINRQS